MNTPDEHHGFDSVVVSLVLLALGLSASVVAWRTMKSHEHSDLRSATKLAAQAAQLDLKTDMEWQVLGLDRLALLWELNEPPQPLWTENAELYIQHRPGCVAVEWLTPDAKRTVIVRAHSKLGSTGLAFDGVPAALMDAAAHSNSAIVSAPVALPNGRAQWVVTYPVYARGHAQGFIVAFFDFETSLDYILGDMAELGFSLAISESNGLEYFLPGSSPQHERDWETVVEVPLPGVNWQLRAWPRSDVANAILSSMPQVTLILGTLVSLLLALTVYFAIRATRASMRTRQANQRLRTEIEVREGVERQLRQAHDELETRVQQRTAELGQAVTEHERAEQLLRELTGRLFRLQDDERRRLARELHDGPTQQLFALAMNLSAIRDAPPACDNRSAIVSNCAEIVEQCTAELRTISFLLHPPLLEELGLPVCLKNYVDGFSKRSQVEVGFEIAPGIGRLGNQLELTIFRVVQEALSNVHRHSKSETASVRIARENGAVQLDIVDSGKGIPPELLSGGGIGVGIASMRERVRAAGGHLEISSSGAGTHIHATFPATAKQELAQAGAAA